MIGDTRAFRAPAREDQDEDQGDDGIAMGDVVSGVGIRGRVGRTTTALLAQEEEGSVAAKRKIKMKIERVEAIRRRVMALQGTGIGIGAGAGFRLGSGPRGTGQLREQYPSVDGA